MKHTQESASVELGLIPAFCRATMNIREAREMLRLSQREAAEGAGIPQAAVSRMETGRLPIAAHYAEWLAAQVIEKKRYKRIQDIPPKVLAKAIRERKEM